MRFAYKRVSPRGFSETVEAVHRALRAHGFDVVCAHDLQSTLAAKGFAIQPLVILEVASAAGGDLQCKVDVYVEGEAVWVAAIRPTVLSEVVEGRRSPAAEALDAAVRRVVDDACNES